MYSNVYFFFHYLPFRLKTGHKEPPVMGGILCRLSKTLRFFL
nr:MAG TPA: hypothetical protein [Caudoviricetes sp.]